MKENFIKEINKLKKHVITQTTKVEYAIGLAIKAVHELSPEIAEQVISGDAAIDREEINIEEECLKILALYQPVATDLRTVIALLKINTALERIADYAVHTVRRMPALILCKGHDDMVRIDFEPMAQAVIGMLRDSSSVVNSFDLALAHDVIRRDDEADKFHALNVAQISKIILQHPENICYYLQAQGVSRDLERVADLTSDICEHIVYLQTGKIIRHGNRTTAAE